MSVLQREVRTSARPNPGPGAGRVPRGGLDPHLVVTFGSLAVCHHCDHDLHCGLSLVPAGRAPETVAASDDLPLRVDWLQHELRQGPAFTGLPGEVLVSEDLAADDRWPDFGRMCVAALNLRSMVSVRVPVAEPDHAMLNFFCSQPGGLDGLDIDAARGIARLATDAAHSQLEEFRAALATVSSGDFSRMAIALGAVMDAYHLSSPQAFRLLRETSHELDRPLLAVAIETVASGRLPCVPARSGFAAGAVMDSLDAVAGRPRPLGGPDLWRSATPA